MHRSSRRAPRSNSHSLASALCRSSVCYLIFCFTRGVPRLASSLPSESRHSQSKGLIGNKATLAHSRRGSMAAFGVGRPAIIAPANKHTATIIFLHGLGEEECIGTYAKAFMISIHSLSTDRRKLYKPKLTCRRQWAEPFHDKSKLQTASRQVGISNCTQQAYHPQQWHDHAR